MYSAPIRRRSAGTARRRDADETRTGSQSADRSQECGAGLAARAGDDEHAPVVALMRIRLSRLQDLSHPLARQQVETRAREVVDHFRWDSDVGHDDIARERLARGQHSGSFGAASVTVIAA